ncbi:hypothetical protein [Brachybacterium sp. SGAir0954]|uniref:hypothetical protein n=1 Tax=Brachybacterium sp. SGAir0954 TaxID=2571029 RepID=UPI00143D95AE|nr:hypothetical protein [Brachybacterium sp. SGAir0954]
MTKWKGTRPVHRRADVVESCRIARRGIGTSTPHRPVLQEKKPLHQMRPAAHTFTMTD